MTEAAALAGRPVRLDCDKFENVVVVVFLAAAVAARDEECNGLRVSFVMVQWSHCGLDFGHCRVVKSISTIRLKIAIEKLHKSNTF